MSNEIAVVIGSGSIGVAIGRRAAVGRTLILADVNQKAVEAVATQLRGEGYDVTTHPIDISDRASVATLAGDAAALGDVTRVIIAAGVSPVQASTERVLAVDLAGTAYVLEEFGRVIAPGGSGLVIASMAGHMGDGYPNAVEQPLHTRPPPNCWHCRPSIRRRSATPALLTRSPNAPTLCGCRPKLCIGVPAVPA